jgi:adenine phosphoribosyltransferase
MSIDERIAQIQGCIRDVPDFPKPGIMFKDIAPLLESPEGFRTTIDLLAERWSNKGVEAIAALESRGFPFGGALADRLGVGFVMIRKPGKLPYEKVGVDYALEYGTDRVEMHVGAVQPDQRVLLVDDLLATGGTAEASIKLLRDAAGADVVGCAFVIELAFLNGASRLAPTPIDALITY